MVVKVYVSGISGNHEIRKQQQRVLFTLSSLKIEFEVIDITEMGKEDERSFMRSQCREQNRPNALPPQIFNDLAYCGDFSDFETATEDDTLYEFLKVERPSSAEDVPKMSNVETGESEAIEA